MSDWNKHYHWKTKGCTPWAKQYFQEKLVNSTSELANGSGSVKIDEMTAFEGDCELGNRKGKLITIYDQAITLSWSGETKDGGKANGTMTWPEVSHQVEDDGEEYTFETTLSSASDAAASSLYDAVRKQLGPSLLPHFHAFRKTLIDTHAPDLGHDSSHPNSGTSTPATKSAAAPAAASKAPVGAKSSDNSSSVATSANDIKLGASLAVDQNTLWDLLTNPARIPMWSKAPAEFSTTPGSSFALFGGNVTGSIVSSDAPNKLVQRWRAPTWPAGHFGELTLLLAQGSDTTRLDLVLKGVPADEAGKAEQALEAFYIRGLKSMGLATVL